jgi:Zn-dependent alcohol dehydrogenase
MSGVRGTTVIVGIPPATETFTFSAFDFLTSERVLTAGFMGSTNIKSDMPKLFSLYKSGKLKLDELITNRYPLAQINEAIENTIQGKPCAMSSYSNSVPFKGTLQILQEVDCMKAAVLYEVVNPGH